ncbi:MAG: cytochrome c3 family protein [Planctomycetota bacterium]
MGRGSILFLTALALITGGSLLSASGKARSYSAQSVRERFPDPDSTAAPDRFVGITECEECHPDRHESLGTSFHRSLLSSEKNGSKGCESCHGPGLAHADDGGDGPIRHPRKADPREINGVCLRCHAEVLVRPARGHRDWVEGEALGKKVRACVTCHSVHVDANSKAYDETLGPVPDIAALEKHAKYVSASRCIDCHPGFHPEMRRSGHARLLAEGKTCGTCHGPGSLHAESGGDRRKILYPKKQRPAAIDATCNGCHAKGEALARWTCSEHSKEGISCIVCHDANGRAGKTLRKPQFELCGSCHLDVKTKLRLPNRHRVREGRLDCTNCHDPHGNTAKVRDRDVRLKACLDCHSEKGGPFLHDHGVKRTEGCVACHDPHGSPNRRMLTHTRTKSLCLQCHPEVPHNLAERKYDNCIACHVEIHGSDLDRFFRR